jgi:sporulation protein YlmC with PRC-barrel domain
MDDASEFAIGGKVTCEDRACGHLRRVVIDPVARAVTHLVVEPGKWSGPDRLVPIDLLDSSADEIRLRCSGAEFDALEDAEETRFLSDASAQLGYGSGEIYAWPYYGLGLGPDVGLGTGAAAMPPFITEDRVPLGEVEVRRGEQVHATDGEIGQLHGLVIDPRDHHVTHILLEEGHLWGKKKVAIPIGAVADVAEGGLQLALTREQISALPPVDHASHD